MTAQAQVPGLHMPGASSARKAAPARPPAATQKEEAKPLWSELTPVQQQTLAPLGASWRSLSEPHKRKWLALAESYPRMSPAGQAKLRSRMTEWAALSPQQRTTARLNFEETKKVAPSDKKAAWEAYQQLPAEEKKRLAAGAAAVKPPPPPTAPAVKPVSPQRLAKVPKPQVGDTKAPRIAATTDSLENHLVPAPAASDTKH
ncbi:DUF3106 domain-containing protein [Ramlibacter sp. GTP1]|uniref:DUF3106 domain-containing protein n=2 Tax=Ramlibacter albus TaxID=2079448 RepID=A0A923ME06_9BURK|nr:DUF3106 domain-containing protein [Ramlibacter albus]